MRRRKGETPYPAGELVRQYLRSYQEPTLDDPEKQAVEEEAEDISLAMGIRAVRSLAPGEPLRFDFGRTERIKAELIEQAGLRKAELAGQATARALVDAGLHPDAARGRRVRDGSARGGRVTNGRRQEGWKRMQTELESVLAANPGMGICEARERVAEKLNTTAKTVARHTMNPGRLDR